MEVPQNLINDAEYHETFFSQLLDRIPQHLILPQTEKEEEETAAARFYKHRKLATPLDEKRQVAKDGKKARFDPDNQLTISERQKAREGKQGEEEEDIMGESDEEDSENEKDFVDDVEDDEEGNDEDDDDEDEEEEMSLKRNSKGKILKQKRSKKSGKKDHDNQDNKTNVGGVERESINVLREKLAKRILDFRSSRNLKEPGSGKPRHDRNSKPPPKQKTDKPNFGNKRKGVFSDETEQDSKQSQLSKVTPIILSTKEKAVMAIEKEKNDKKKEAQDIARKKIEESGDIQFTMLQVLDSNKSSKSNKDMKVPGPGSKVAKMKSLLMRAEEKEKKMQFLKTQGEEGMEKVMTQNWKDTLKAATGEKVLEDKNKLKKALKRREQQKKKSTKKWDQITKDLEDAKHSKQDKRENNLKNRSNNGYPIPGSESTDKETGTKGKGGKGNGKGATKGGGKGGKGGGKGSALNGAGFEGKKNGFLNKSK